jgi:hypothetical protein
MGGEKNALSYPHSRAWIIPPCGKFDGSNGRHCFCGNTDLIGKKYGENESVCQDKNRLTVDQACDPPFFYFSFACPGQPQGTGDLNRISAINKGRWIRGGFILQATHQ